MRKNTQIQINISLQGRVVCVCVCLFLSRAAFFTSLTRNPLFWILPVYRNFGIFRIEFWATFSQVCSVGLVLQNINRCYLKKKMYTHTNTHICQSSLIKETLGNTKLNRVNQFFFIMEFLGILNTHTLRGCILSSIFQTYLSIDFSSRTASF